MGALCGHVQWGLGSGSGGFAPGEQFFPVWMSALSDAVHTLQPRDKGSKSTDSNLKEIGQRKHTLRTDWNCCWKIRFQHMLAWFKMYGTEQTSLVKTSGQTATTNLPVKSRRITQLALHAHRHCWPTEIAWRCCAVLCCAVLCCAVLCCAVVLVTTSRTLTHK